MDNKVGKGVRLTRYLVYRLLIWLAVLFAVLIVLYFLYIARPDLMLTSAAGVIVGLFIIGMAAGMYLWIVRPYLTTEYRMRRILDGYMTLVDPDTSDEVVLTPSIEEAGREVYRIMNSSQTVNLNKRQAQYLALQNQINPHFLYNTLDGIRSEALIAGLDNVAEMTEALAVFFRYTISNVENLVTIEDEIENCRTYFRIQQYRFGERLALEIRMEQPDLGSYLIPKLTLQPIVENSIIHGTEMKIGKGTTIIDVCKLDERILIAVRDDGVGMEEDVLERLNRRLDSGLREELGKMDSPSEAPVGGIALNNVNNRIRLLFGPEYGIQVYSIKNIGTTVEISLPAETAETRRAEGGRDGQ